MSIRTARTGITAAFFLSVSTGAALATPITIGDPYLQWFNLGPNNLSFGNGEFVRYGATNVTPNGPSGGTTGTATTTNSKTGGTINLSNMVGTTSAAVPNFFEGRLRLCSAPCGINANNNPANLT